MLGQGRYRHVAFHMHLLILRHVSDLLSEDIQESEDSDIQTVKTIYKLCTDQKQTTKAQGILFVIVLSRCSGTLTVTSVKINGVANATAKSQGYLCMREDWSGHLVFSSLISCSQFIDTTVIRIRNS